MSENQDNILTEEVVEQDINILKRIRLEKLDDLVKNGANPYEITKFEVTAKNADIKNNFDEMDGKTVSIAGRIMSWRDMGKANFIDIADNTGRLQVYVKMNDMGRKTLPNSKMGYW